MRKSKNHYFYHIFVSPGDPPGAIMLNVVWMEREFDAYKLSSWMCPSNYNHFWDRAIYWSKIVNFSYPLYSTPRRNIATPFGMEKLEWCGYPMVKKFRRYLYSFWHNSRTWRTDRQTDRHRVTAYTALMHMHRTVIKLKKGTRLILQQFISQCNRSHCKWRIMFTCNLSNDESLY